MSKGTHAVIAIAVAVLIMGSMRSFGNPVRGIGDDLILGLFSLAVVGVFIALGWFAYSSLPGGSRGSRGGGGVSPADFAALRTAVDTGFTDVQARIDAVKVDTGETRKAVDEVKTAVGRMEALMAAWAPELKDLKSTIAGLLSPIGKGVDDIKKLTEELIEWKNKTWKKFSDDITLAVGEVFNKVKTVDVDLAALTGAVKKLDTDQQGIATVVGEIRKEQGLLQKSVTDGFSALPASVAKEVQTGLTAMQTALSGQIGTIATNQAAMQGMLSGFVTTFTTWQGQVDRTLGSLPASTASAIKGDLDAVRVAMKAETDAIRADLTRELGSLAGKQTSVQDALVRLTDAQDKMRKRLKKALAALPFDLQQVMEAQLQRVEGVFTKNIQDLTAAQKVTSGEVAGLASTVQGAQQTILANLEAQRQALQGEFNRQLVGIQTVIHDELEPVTKEMQAINLRIGQVLQQIQAQSSSLNSLRGDEQQRFIEMRARVVGVQSLLIKIEQEGAKASALDEVDNNVGIILDWCGQNGVRIQQLAGQLPAMNPLLDELRKLVEKLQERQRKARDRAAVAVKRHEQMGVVAGRGARFDSIAYNARAATFFVSLELLRLHMDRPVAQISDEEKQKSLQRAIPILEAERQALCVGEDSSLEQRRRALQRFEKRKAVNPLYPKLELEGVLLTALCDESTGSLYKLFKQLQARAQETPFNLRQVKTIITKLKEDGAFEKVVQFSTEARQTEVKQRLGI